MERAANKGIKGGACYREACDNDEAWWYNFSTKKFYCGSCALRINIANPGPHDFGKGVRRDFLCEMPKKEDREQESTTG